MPAVFTSLSTPEMLDLYVNVGSPDYTPPAQFVPSPWDRTSAELVDCFTKRLTLQERATHQIADALCRHLGARGAGCVIEAEQLCLALPEEKHDQSGVVTSAFVGEMRERPDLKTRLLEAAKLGGRAR
jgi:hypothetical protein